jgi:hypothetical protein
MARAKRKIVKQKKVTQLLPFIDFQGVVCFFVTIFASLVLIIGLHFSKTYANIFYMIGAVFICSALFALTYIKLLSFDKKAFTTSLIIFVSFIALFMQYKLSVLGSVRWLQIATAVALFLSFLIEFIKRDFKKMLASIFTSVSGSLIVISAVCWVATLQLNVPIDYMVVALIFLASINLPKVFSTDALVGHFLMFGVAGIAVIFEVLFGVATHRILFISLLVFIVQLIIDMLFENVNIKTKYSLVAISLISPLTLGALIYAITSMVFIL